MSWVSWRQSSVCIFVCQCVSEFIHLQHEYVNCAGSTTQLLVTTRVPLQVSKKKKKSCLKDELRSTQGVCLCVHVCVTELVNWNINAQGKHGGRLWKVFPSCFNMPQKGYSVYGTKRKFVFVINMVNVQALELPVCLTLFLPLFFCFTSGFFPCQGRFI